jgi:hypothetical protein
MSVRWRTTLAAVLVPVALVAASAAAQAAAPAAAPAHGTTAPHWVWSKSYKLPGRAKTGGIGGISCPSAHLCIADAAGVGGGPHGIYYTTDPAGTASRWHYKSFSEPFAGADGGDDVSCDLAGAHTDCAMVGWQPVGGVWQDSYGGSIFQSGTPTGANWGAALVDTDENGDLSAVSCWANVQCASLDDAGNVLTTAGATVTSGPTALWPQDSGFSGIWAINCARGVNPNPFCAAVDQTASHSIAWSTDPSDGAWQVRRVPVPRGDLLWHIACASAGACVVTENNDTGGGYARIAVSHGDTAGKVWASTFKGFDLFPKDSGAGVSAVTCQAAKLCFAAGTSKKSTFVSVSKDPAVPSSWHTYSIKGGWLPFSMSCATAKLCVVMSGNGDFVVGALK